MKLTMRHLLFLAVAPALAQNVAPMPPAAAFHAIDALPLRMDGPVLTQRVAAGEPFTVAGPQGVLVGQQQGVFEAWVLPVKLLSHLTLDAEVDGYNVPLDLNSMAREIEVRPDRTTITYSHIAVVVRQIMFAPSGNLSADGADDATLPGTGAVVLFQVDSVHPVTLHLSFTADMREMWPKQGSGTPAPEWLVPKGALPTAAGGFYLLHTDFESFTGAVALPGATPGTLAPFSERPQVHPLEFFLRVMPRDRGKMFPLLMGVGRTAATSSAAALTRTLQQLNDTLPAIYAAHAAHFAKEEKQWTSITTPDVLLNADLAWAETSIGQLRAKTAPMAAGAVPEEALVAGYYASGDSARPGFGWFFGRDALTTLSAVDSYGDFALAKAELAFLMKRQRADGKMMHEFSQTAGELDWSQFPYEYAAADATPLFLAAMLDYVRASGDVDFLKAHRDQVMKAWAFESTHDKDGDGVYDNAQGTGWVEDWSPAAPQQEIYLALYDQQASAAMSEMARLLGDSATSTAAHDRALKLHTTIESEYYRAATGTYDFSRNAASGTVAMDKTATLYPSVAWWSAEAAPLDHPQASLRAWASHDFDTDWGTRDVAESDPLYDPITYHRGSVWPLFTGWAALAQYRSGHALAGYAALMQNADLTRAQDIGAVTELLSGAFFEPFGRSTSHQLWSSAMVITPLLRGMFGIRVDATAHTLVVAPSLPADWPAADVRNLHVGDAIVDLHFERVAGAMVVTAKQTVGPAVLLAGAGSGSVLKLPLPAFDVAIPHGLPLRGARTTQMKVLDQTSDAHSLQLQLEAPGGSEATLRVVRNEAKAKLTVDGASLTDDKLQVQFPAGDGYRTQVVTLRW